ncbi:MAG: hypothetical protein PF542_06310 [Nanoarchaeota archaeon]|jgi:hypothetical protein|nr:hypothetical protein [Nanoarchaeota archaeon]
MNEKINYQKFVNENFKTARNWTEKQLGLKLSLIELVELRKNV